MKDDPDLHVFPAAYLKNFAAEVFMYFGIADADAWQAADVLSRSGRIARYFAKDGNSVRGKVMFLNKHKRSNIGR